MIDLVKGKEVLVVGMARSGLAAVELLNKTGASNITITDSKKSSELQKEIDTLKRYKNLKYKTGSNPPELVTQNLSLIVKSPGVPPTLEIFKKAEELSIPIVSEIELAYAFLKTPIIGVTGTNGKTTTTALITAMLKEARLEPVVSAGNIGNPLAGLFGKISPQGFIVAELSSFQLENIINFRPAIAVFLNFAEDHLDYHGSIEKYFKAKARIFENQVEGDYAVLNAGDYAVSALSESCKSRVIWFDRLPVKLGVGLEQEWVTIFNPGFEAARVCKVSELALPGEHNLENALAAAAAAWAAGADSVSIGKVLRSFKAIEHRLEHVAVIDDVVYINDSKGTNPGATIKALLSFPGKNKILIAGGKEKGSNFSDLASVIKREVKALILIGETADRIANAARDAGFENYSKYNSLEEAVFAASRLAEREDLVLLSPACASWDMFSDFEERGSVFKRFVNSLKTEKETEGGTVNG